jgi:hypothetical protein
MLPVLHSLGMLRLEAENLFLRHQLSIALRRAPPRLRLRGSDRASLVGMTRLWPSLLGAALMVQPETILRWRWKSGRRQGGQRCIGPSYAHWNPAGNRCRPEVVLAMRRQRMSIN